jgi:preprotein translocase subunit SecA
MLKKFVNIFGGDPNKRTLEKFYPFVGQINDLESQFEALSDEALQGKTAEFRARVAQGESLDEILPEAFAAVREAGKRTLGLRHYDVQMIGGIALHQATISEMRTGEGKTLVATLPIYLNALTGRGVHLITVNDYLARRDARWMAPLYNLLGLSVGVLQMAARTENGKKAFLVDLEKESPHEDQHQLRMVPRREAYAADITYGTNSEFGFDYLRDNMTMSLAERVQRGHYFAIVDEVDNVLIDEARTPLIISGPASDDTEWYVRMAQVVRKLRDEDYEISERDRTVTLTEIGETHVEELLDMPLRDPDRPEDVTPEQARLMGYLEQSLRAQYLFKRNKDYLVQAGKVIIVDEFTGRMMPGRRWSDGLHQAVEAKEGVRVQPENVTYATITIQNYFRMYEKLAGMTGTALTEAEEFDKIYRLNVVAIPTNLEYQALQSDSPLVEQEDRDEHGYRYTYYANQDDPGRPIFWKRKDYPDVIFLTEEAKFRAIVKEILRFYTKGRPVLVGTTSVELSDRLSGRLRAEPLRRLAQVQIIRDAWLQAHNREEDGRQIQELQPLNVSLDELQIADLRKMAQSLGVSLNPEEEGNLERLCSILELEPEDQERLVSALKAGVSHNVLNARKHTEESQIIAGAGSFGAVTIATNMAGRGVDIKLGGELAEEVLITTSRVLRRGGYRNPYEMQMEERRQALLKLDKASYGIYEAQVNSFLEYIQNMERVKSLGGLHVIGSERHEARRIDNQLRGRAARQGDPGSSRFYLSLEDDLMRRFGGQQANDMMQRLKVDEALPIEVGMVGRIVEQSQTRVEGANFDIRKHLLEYDDVLNSQRSKIYEQRNIIFVKEDLSEDVTGMLRTEVLERIPRAVVGVEGPWELLAWLDQIQPAFSSNGTLFPSFTHKLLLDQVNNRLLELDDEQAEMKALLEVAEGSLEAEQEHVLLAVNTLLDQLQDRFEARLLERRDILDTFFEGLDTGDETEVRQPRELLDELSGLLHIPLRLQSEQQRLLKSDPEEVRLLISEQIENTLLNQELVRLLGAVQRRLGESLELTASQLPSGDWDELAEQVLSACQAIMERRSERLLGNGQMDGQIVRDLEAHYAREKAPFTLKDKQQIRQSLDGALAVLTTQEGKQNFDQALQEVKAVLLRVDGAASEEQKEQVLEDLVLALRETSANGNVLSAGQRDLVSLALERSLSKVEEDDAVRRRLRMLMVVPMGTQAAFDRKTHRRISQRTIRLVYTYYAARFLDGREPDEIAEEVLEHLESAQTAMGVAWGRNELKRMVGARLSDLDEVTLQGLRNVLGDETSEQVRDVQLSMLPVGEKAIVTKEMGRRALTELYRQLLLSVITELWVDYLTQMEALRVSIGLEAYGQRDPLVQYKSKASGLFQDLFRNMRLGVITRMFTYRPRDIGAMQVTGRRSKEIDESHQPTDDRAQEFTAQAEAGEIEMPVGQVDQRSDGKPQAGPAQDSLEASRSGKSKKLSKSQRRRRGRQ